MTHRRTRSEIDDAEPPSTYRDFDSWPKEFRALANEYGFEVVEALRIKCKVGWSEPERMARVCQRNQAAGQKQLENPVKKDDSSNPT